MLGGACAVLFLGQITPADALASINPDVMVFLLCMFIVGEACCRSGYLDTLTDTLFRYAHTSGELVALVHSLVLGLLRHCS